MDALKVLITDSRAPRTVLLKTVNDVFLSVSSLHLAKSVTNPAYNYGHALFMAIGDPLFTPSLMVTPSQITTLQARQSITLYAYDQSAAFYTLTGVTTVGDGITISGQKSGRVVVGASKLYELALDMTRARGIVGEVIWHFLDHPDIKVSIDAVNPSLWFFKPVFPIKEDWEFATAVIESNKSEERIQNAPHPTCSFIYEHHEKASSMVKSLEKIRNYGTNPILVPWWLDAIPSISVSKGSTAIPAVVDSQRFFDTALIYQSENEYEVVSVTSISSSEMIVKRPLSKSFSNALLIPLLNCIAKSGVNHTVVGCTAKAKVTFSMVEPLRLNPLNWEDNYKSKPVLFQYRKPQKHNVANDWTQKNTQANIPHFSIDRDVIIETLDLELLERDISVFQRKMKTLAGRAEAFWVIDRKLKIELAESSTRDRLIIKPINFSESVGDEANLFLMIDGHRLYVHARFAGMTNKGNEILDIPTTVSGAIEPEQLTDSGLLKLVRSGSDSWTFTHRHKVTSFSLSVRDIVGEDNAGSS